MAISERVSPNLADKSDVTKLLQAALDKYDGTGSYQVELQPDPSRELTVPS